MESDLSAALASIAVFLPISLLGAWRWSVWLARKLAGLTRRRSQEAWPHWQERPRVSVVTPVYNEDWSDLSRALDSWIANGADEIVAVIDYTNEDLIEGYRRDYMPRSDCDCKLIVTETPGKRPALADGARAATGGIICLADSDTIWGEDVVDKVLPHFLNPRIGGVGTRQAVYRPTKLQHILFDIMFWSRYHDEVPFLMAAGKVINTLSGRTAFYRREALLPEEPDNMYLLTHDYFRGMLLVPGDDKCLTHLILQQGWHTGFADDAYVYTPGAPSIKSFLQQKLRWTRNSWRADSKAFRRGWVFKHPALAFHNADRFVQPFVMLIGPLVMTLAVIERAWLFVILLLSWWVASRTIRLFGYFSQDHGGRIKYLPVYIIFSYVIAVLKIYAWATIMQQEWVTRWDPSRIKKRGAALVLKGAAFTTAVMAVSFLFVISLYALLQSRYDRFQRPATINSLQAVELAPAPPAAPLLPAEAATGLNIKSLVVQPGENVELAARRAGVPAETLLQMNYTSPAGVVPGTTLLYPSPPPGL